MKIAIVGTHGVGKSTLSYKIATYYKNLGKNVNIIQEVVRECPFPINEDMKIESAMWIYFRQARKELESTAVYDVTVCDRSKMDSWIYAEHFGLIPQELRRLESAAYDSMRRDYDKIVFIRPDMPLIGDGVRSVNEQLQKEIDRLFESRLKDIPHAMINSSDVFGKVDICSTYLS